MAAFKSPYLSLSCLTQQWSLYDRVYIEWGLQLYIYKIQNFIFVHGNKIVYIICDL
jgi:hypothetical protein